MRWMMVQLPFWSPSLPTCNVFQCLIAEHMPQVHCWLCWALSLHDVGSQHASGTPGINDSCLTC